MSFVIFNTFNPSLITIRESFSQIQLSNLSIGNVETSTVKKPISFRFIEFSSQVSFSEYGYFLCSEPVVVVDSSFVAEDFCCPLGQFTCEDGSCVDNRDDCPPCPPGTFECEDGSCVEFPDDCSPCPPEFPLQCPFGGCVDDLSKCCDGKHTCPDGECVSSPEDCNNPIYPPGGGGGGVDDDEDDGDGGTREFDSSLPLLPCADFLRIYVEPSDSPTVVQEAIIKLTPYNGDPEQFRIRHAIGTNFVDVPLSENTRNGAYIQFLLGSCGGSFFGGPPFHMRLYILFGNTSSTADFFLSERQYISLYDITCESGKILETSYLCYDKVSEDNYLLLILPNGQQVGIPRGFTFYCNPPYCTDFHEITQGNFDPAWLSPDIDYIYSFDVFTPRN